MVNLNLTANGKEQEKILQYLQENASETLAEKINNAVYIEKDGKRLLNKKDLNTFLNDYASSEALKFIAENERKGKKVLCIDDPIVYGWAIHYFEEESIEGTLYNEDGTEYKKVVPTPPKATITSTKVISKTKKNEGQVSIFDMNFDDNTEQAEVETPPSDTKQAVIETVNKQAAVSTQSPKTTEQPLIEQPKQTPQSSCSPAELFYCKYEIMQKQYPDSILFYRLGDFYEAFSKSAELASNALDLTLTGKNCGSYGRVPMCGLPYHAIDAYVDKLRNKYGVVLMHSDKELQVLPKKEFADIVQENAEKLDAMADDEDLGLVIDEDTDKEIDEMSADDYNKYFNNIEDYVDKATGEIKAPKIEKDLFVILYNLFDGQIVMG